MSYSVDDFSNCMTPFYQHVSICPTPPRRIPLYEALPDTMGKASQKAVEIFGQNYTALWVRTEKGKKYIDLQSKGGIIGCLGCTSTLIITVGTIAGIIPSALGWCCTGFSSFTGFSGFCLGFNSRIGPTYRTNYVLKMCDSIAQFSDALTSFKNDPQEDNIKPLFVEFDKFSELLYSQDGPVRWFWKGNPLEIDLKLLKSTDKLFLMDALVEILKEVDQNADIILQWDKMLTSSITSGYMEPWHSLGIPNPSHDAYKRFGYLRDRVNFFKLVDVWIELFQKILNNEILNNFDPVQDEEFV